MCLTLCKGLFTEDLKNKFFSEGHLLGVEFEIKALFRALLRLKHMAVNQKVTALVLNSKNAKTTSEHLSVHSLSFCFSLSLFEGQFTFILPSLLSY